MIGLLVRISGWLGMSFFATRLLDLEDVGLVREEVGLVGEDVWLVSEDVGLLEEAVRMGEEEVGLVGKDFRLGRIFRGV